MNIYILILIGGILGILAHSLKTINEINKRTVFVNFSDVFIEYWKRDKLSLLTSFFCFAILLFVADEFVNFNAIDAADVADTLSDKLLHFRVGNFVKVTAVIAGYFSDSLVYGFMGKTEKQLHATIPKYKR